MSLQYMAFIKYVSSIKTYFHYADKRVFFFLCDGKFIFLLLEDRCIIIDVYCCYIKKELSNL